MLSEFLERARAGLASHHPGSWWFEAGRTFLHNALLDYVAMRLGVAGGVIPGAYALFNSIVTGTVFAGILAADRLGALALLLPHAIFELPALFIATGLGLWLGLGARQSHEKTSPVRRANEVFLLIVLPLALVAAMLEEASFTNWRPRHVQARHEMLEPFRRHLIPGYDLVQHRSQAAHLPPPHGERTAPFAAVSHMECGRPANRSWTTRKHMGDSQGIHGVPAHRVTEQ